MNAISSIASLADARTTLSASQTATVVKSTEGGVLIKRHGRELFARVALSCLIVPQPGDEVLTATGGEEYWVTAILTRAGNAPLRLQASGDLVIGAAGSLSMHAETLNVSAPKANLLLAEVMHVGRQLTANLPALKLIGGVIETLAERVLLRAKWSQRVIEKADVSHAGTIDQTAAEGYTLQAENAFITAGNAVRVDASQIHMG